MTGTLTNADIIKGSALMLFFGDGGPTGVASAPVAFATEHSMEINVETVEISSKDHGDYAATLPQRITWTCSASNLYSDEGEETYYNYINSMTPIKVKFAKASEYNPYLDADGAEKGIVGDNVAQTAWTPGDTIAEGEALITSLSINASAGDNATMQISLQGVGALTTGATGTQSSGSTQQ